MTAWFPARVAGPSMLPTLQDGDVVAFRGLRRGEPTPGQVVCVRTAERELVKRVERRDGETVWLAGDNADASTDSRTLGAFPVEQVAGVAVLVYLPFRRIRRIR